MSSTTFIDYVGSSWEENTMELEGAIYYFGQDTRAPFRGRWSVMESGSVLQEFWQRDGEGKWGTWFVGEYRRSD